VSCLRQHFLEPWKRDGVAAGCCCGGAAGPHLRAGHDLLPSILGRYLLVLSLLLDCHYYSGDLLLCVVVVLAWSVLPSL
jgi:hypothetical protein